jgi:transposase-like protein
MKKNQSYTAEFKAEAVKLVLEQKLSHQEAAQRVGVPKGSRSNWVAELKAEVSRLRRERERPEAPRQAPLISPWFAEAASDGAASRRCGC